MDDCIRAVTFHVLHFDSSRLGQSLAPGETRVKVVPELDVILVLLPAQEDFPAAHHGGEINQAAIQVLELNVQLTETGEALLDAGQVLDPFIDEFPARIGASRQQLAETFLASIRKVLEADLSAAEAARADR